MKIWRTRLFKGARIFTVVLLLALILWQVEPGRLAGYFSRDLFLAMLAMQGPMMVAILLITWRHALLVRSPPLPFWVTFRAVVLSAGLNLVLPARVSEVVKASYLRQHAEVPLSSGVGAIMVERLGDVVVVGSIALIAISGAVLSVNWTVWATTVGLAILLLSLLPWLEAPMLWLTARFPLPGMRFVGRVLIHATTNVRNGIFAWAMLLGAVSWLCNLAGFVLFFQLQPPGGPLMTPMMVATVFAAVTFAGAVPALPGGIGMYQAAAVVVLEQYGFSVEHALVLAVITHIGQSAIPALLTPILLMQRSTGLSAALRDGVRMIRER